MLDGSIYITDWHKTEENRVLVRKFAEDDMVNGRTDQIAQYLDEDLYSTVPALPMVAKHIS